MTTTNKQKPKTIVVAAQDPLTILLRKGDEIYLRKATEEEPPPADRLIDDVCVDPEDTIMAFLGHDFRRVLGENGEPNPEMDDDDYPLVEAATVDGVDVWKVKGWYSGHKDDKDG